MLLPPTFGRATSEFRSCRRLGRAAAAALLLISILGGCLRDTPDASHAEPHAADKALCGTAARAEVWTQPVPALPSDAALLSTAEGHALLLSDPRIGSHRLQVPAPCLEEGIAQTSAVRICVSPMGKVSSVHVVQPSTPLIDEQLPDVIARWSYRHHEVAGQPTPFCYGMQYRVR